VSPREAVRKILELFSGREPWWVGEGLDPFWIMVAAAVSPRTTGRLTERAVRRLMERFPGGAEDVASADVSEVEEAVSVSGMKRSKARAVKAIASWLLSGGLERISSASLEEARRELLSIPGVGDKVADVILMALGRPVLPVDVHVRRVSERLGLVSPGAPYSEVRERLEEIFDPEERASAHFALIAFGREICRARPRCSECPIREACPSADKF